MRLFCKTISPIVLVLIACVFMLASTGCKSKGVGLPNFGDLAWWKKDDIRLAAPPPSTHFEPEPAMQMQAKNIQDNVEDLASDAEEMADDVKGLASKPIRTPYSFGEDGLGSAKRGVDRAAEDLKTRLPDWNSSKLASSTAAGIKDVQASLDNSFAATKEAVKKSSNDFDAGWKSNFALPANKESNGFDKTINAARNSLNRVADSDTSTNNFASQLNQAVDNATSATEQFAGNIKEQANQFGSDKSFQPSVQNQFKSATNQFNQTANSNVQQAMDQFQQNVNQGLMNSATQLKPVASKAQQVVNQSQLQQQAIQLQQQANELLQQANRIQQQASNQMESVQQATGNAFSNIKNSSNQLAGHFQPQPTSPTHSLARLNVPRLNQSTKADYMPQTGNALQMTQRSFQTAPQTHHQSGMPSNTLRPIGTLQQPAQTFQPPAQQPVSQPVIKPANGDESYPSTPHKNYAPRGELSKSGSATGLFGNAQQVGFNQEHKSQPQVVTADGQGFKSSNDDPVNDFSGNNVIVPEVISRGTGSFAPGSVRTLLPNEK